MPDASEHAACPPRSISAMRHVLVLSLLLLLLPNMSKPQEAEAAPEPATADAMPPSPAWLDELEALYDPSIRVPALEDRPFYAEPWWDVALTLTTHPLPLTAAQ